MAVCSYGLHDLQGHPLYIERMGTSGFNWLWSGWDRRRTDDCVATWRAGGIDSGTVCKIMNEDVSIMRYIHHQEMVLQECREV